MILIPSDAPVGFLVNAVGIAQKAGFANIRMFVYSENSGRMSEVAFDAAEPFSLNPD